MWRLNAYFRLFRHVTLHLVHWASNATAAIEIFPNTHQKKWRYIVYRLKKQLQSINLHKTTNKTIG